MSRLDEIEAALAARKTRGDGPRIVTSAYPYRPPVMATVDAIPVHHCYVEAGDPVLPLFVAKPPSPIEVVNDATRRFADFFAYDPNETTVKLLQRTNGAVLLVGPEKKLPEAFRLRASSNGDGVWLKHA